MLHVQIFRIVVDCDCKVKKLTFSYKQIIILEKICRKYFRIDNSYFGGALCSNLEV